MDVEQAVLARRSIRQFRPDPVPDEALAELLALASRAPSGGNVQPWRLYVVNGGSMQRLRDHRRLPRPGAPRVRHLPAAALGPYRSNRFALGEQMYAAVGIPARDKGRLRQFAHNGDFFRAPAAIFCFIDRGMGPPQWSDCGMFLQTFMLLATAAGLGTCAQEYWSVRHGAVAGFVGAPPEEMLFCGVGIGYADEAAPSTRCAPSAWRSATGRASSNAARWATAAGAARMTPCPSTSTARTSSSPAPPAASAARWLRDSSPRAPGSSSTTWTPRPWPRLLQPSAPSLSWRRRQRGRRGGAAGAGAR